MLKAQQIVDKAERFIGPEASRLAWRVGVTNNCQQIFDAHAPASYPKKCYEAADHHEARKALAELVKRGFNGINASLPLADFKFVFLYETESDAERRNRQPGNFITATAKPARARRTPAPAPFRLGARRSAGSRRNQTGEPATPKVVSALIAIVFVIFSLPILIFGIAFITALLGFQFGHNFETEELDRAMATIGTCDDGSDSEVRDIKHTRQYCWYTPEAVDPAARGSGIITVLVIKSDHTEALLEIWLNEVCVGGYLTEDTPRHSYIRGENFWIQVQGANSRNELQLSANELKAGNQLTEQVHGRLTAAGLETELLDWCQSDYSQQRLAQASSAPQSQTIATNNLNGVLGEYTKCGREATDWSLDPDLKPTRQICSYQKDNGDALDLRIYRGENQPALIEKELKWNACKTAEEPFGLEKYMYILGDKFTMRVNFVYNADDNQDRHSWLHDELIAEQNDLTAEIYPLLVAAGLEAELLDSCQSN